MVFAVKFSLVKFTNCCSNDAVRLVEPPVAATIAKFSIIEALVVARA